MTVKETINSEDTPTIDQLGTLNSADLREVANKLFEIKNVSNFKKDELLLMCGDMLAQYEYEMNKKTAEDFVRNEDNQTKSVSEALNIRNAFDRSWFEAEDLLRAYMRAISKNIDAIDSKGDLSAEKKAEQIAEGRKELEELTVDSVKAKLATLQLFGLVKKKSFKGGRKVKYKIVLGLVTKAMNRKRRREEEAKAKEKYNDRSAEENKAGK